jgi:hypothetical protein
MPPFLNLHAIARPGDGLRPELRALFERLATARHRDVTARGDRIVQSQPDKTLGREGKRKPPLNLSGSK